MLTVPSACKTLGRAGDEIVINNKWLQAAGHGQQQQGLIKNARARVYAFHGNVWPFVCIVKAMSMDIIELSMPLFLHIYIYILYILYCTLFLPSVPF